MINILWQEILADQNLWTSDAYKRLEAFGEKVAWTDAVMTGKFQSHFTGRHCMFAKSIPERDGLKTALSSKVAVTEYRGQETWTEFCLAIPFSLKIKPPSI